MQKLLHFACSKFFSQIFFRFLWCYFVWVFFLRGVPHLICRQKPHVKENLNFFFKVNQVAKSSAFCSMESLNKSHRYVYFSWGYKKKSGAIILWTSLDNENVCYFSAAYNVTKKVECSTNSCCTFQDPCWAQTFPISLSLCIQEERIPRSSPQQRQLMMIMMKCHSPFCTALGGSNECAATLCNPNDKHIFLKLGSSWWFFFLARLLKNQGWN